MLHCALNDINFSPGTDLRGIYGKGKNKSASENKGTA